MDWRKITMPWRKLFQPRRRFPVVQLEVTSRCQLSCRYCPHAILKEGGEGWYNTDLPWEVFERYLAPCLPQIGLIYFQGWGEPLLHPRLLDMIELAKARGCRVGFTTNGILLGPGLMERLVELPCDILGLSVAGGTPATHASLRAGSSLKRLLANSNRLAEIKARYNSPLPKIHCSYLMTRSNLAELPAFLEQAAAAGVDEVVTINLDLTLTPAMEALRAFACPGEEYEEQQAQLQAAEGRAAALGIPLRTYPLQFNPRVMVCDALPLKHIFINSRGEVAPCVYLGLPFAGPIPRFFCNQQAPVTPFNYGNVTAGLASVVRNKAARGFRQYFQHRLELTNPFLLANPEVPLPPPPCRSCYKLYGL